MLNIYDFVKTEETAYQSRGITPTDGFEWHMHKNLRDWSLYKDGKRTTSSDEDVPVKNIILPILNYQYRVEGFNVTDIELYVDSDENYHKSFLVRKFHDGWARREGMDTFIDELVQSYVDLGGVLAKRVKGARPEVIPLQKLAFCDQTDILAGPFAIKHQYSVDQLIEKGKAWDKDAIDDVIFNARYEKAQQAQGQKSKTPGKYIEVYEVHGMFPNEWLTDDSGTWIEDGNEVYTRQIHIVTFCTTSDPNLKRGVTLFKGRSPEGLFKLLKRDGRYGTALGRSAIEELVESQVWTNYSMIQIKQMLEKAAIMLGVTDDPTFANRNRFTDLEKGEWLIKQPNTNVNAFEFPASNLANFENAVTLWENHARVTASANESVLGVSPSSGTPFKLQELITDENKGVHVWRQGIIATFVEEIYRDWVIDEMVSEMNKGQKFLTELSLDELQEVAEKAADSHVNKLIKERILSGGVAGPESVEALKQFARDSFSRDPKKFIELMKDEFADIPLDVKVNIAGKQKNLASITDKLVNIFREVIVNPQLLQNPNAARAFNKIIEFSGLSPIEFKPIQSPMQVNQMPMQPMMSLPTNK